MIQYGDIIVKLQQKKETTLELLETSPEIDNKSFQIKCIIQYMIQV